MRDRPNDKHRVAAAAKLGRPLLPTEDAHHLDEDKGNNAPANLQVKSHGKHAADHSTRGGRKLSRLQNSLRMHKEGRKMY